MIFPLETGLLDNCSISFSSKNIFEALIRLDAINPHTDDCYNDNTLSEITNEEFCVEDESIENNERNNTFKDIVENVLYKLTDIERRIVKKRFGIDFPY